ncbi:MAG: hypothetical protein Q4G43_09170 [Mobilicoccus sp.]|nr:hypothetical protein [Mobilicoccus sp.]
MLTCFSPWWWPGDRLGHHHALCLTMAIFAAVVPVIAAAATERQLLLAIPWSLIGAASLSLIALAGIAALAAILGLRSSERVADGLI